MSASRFARVGPLGFALRWLLRALGFGFVLGAAAGVRATRRGGEGIGGDMADRVERALRILCARETDGPDAKPPPEAGAPT